MAADQVRRRENRLSDGSVMFSRTRHADDQTFAAPIFRHEINAALDRVARIADGNRFPRRADFAAGERVEADDGFGDFGSARADQSGKAENLARAGIERNGVVPDKRLERDVAHLEESRCLRCAWTRRKSF